MTWRDPSRGWDAAADRLIHDRARSAIGVDVLRQWAAGLPPSADVLDLGCGAGVPVSSTLVALGHRVWGIDASPRLVEAYRTRLRGAPVACEPAEASTLFGRTFDGVVAIGLLFLLDEAAQRAVVSRVGRALAPGGRFLFTAPWQTVTWNDVTTDGQSRSLGRAEYLALLGRHRLRVDAMPVDEGGNQHYAATRV